MKNYKIIFSDLDGTLIETKSGNTFAKSRDDYKFKTEVVNKIAKVKPEMLCIVTNQGGIPKFITEEDFNKKLRNIRTYLKAALGIKVYTRYCASEDKNNPDRKPNTGMFKDLYDNYGEKIPKEECLMIGDASGKPGDFSDSDKKSAENFKIDYLDVDDFIKA